jgi:hypothetical protein
VTDRIIRPLGLKATVLPAPGNRSPMGPYAHAYFPVNGKLLDVSNVDPCGVRKSVWLSRHPSQLTSRP